MGGVPSHFRVKPKLRLRLRLGWVGLRLGWGFDNTLILPSHLLKATSIYGLLSSTPILDAVPSGQMKTLPFYRGCKYVAYPARNTEEVKQVCLDHFNKYFS